MSCPTTTLQDGAAAGSRRARDEEQPQASHAAGLTTGAFLLWHRANTDTSPLPFPSYTKAQEVKMWTL